MNTQRRFAGIIVPRRKLVLVFSACLLVAGCATPPHYKGGPLETYDDSAKYNVIDQPDGYEIHLFYEKDNDFGLDEIVKMASGLLGVPGERDDSFDRACEEYIYLVAYRHAEKLGHTQRFVQWEKAKRMSDEVSDISDSPHPGNPGKWSMGRGILYKTTGDYSSKLKCHAYAYFRWKKYSLL